MNNHLINKEASIRDGLNQINSIINAPLVLFVIDNDQKLYGSVTDGDIRRGLLNNFNLTDNIQDIMNKGTLKFETFTNKEFKESKSKHIQLVPIINQQNRLIKIINTNDFTSYHNIDCVIMAGGLGTRLRPLTENTPKPLLKICDRPILERNIADLKKVGINKFHISVNYKANQIKQYFDDGSRFNINIDYIEEDKPLGTAGSLKNYKNYSSEYILMLNGDLITNFNFGRFIGHTITNKFDMCVACLDNEFKIPFGVIETSENGLITDLKEKPTIPYKTNAGIYCFKKKLIDFIPDNEFFNITDLINLSVENKFNIGTFLVDGYWIDIGTPEEFRKAEQFISNLNS